MEGRVSPSFATLRSITTWNKRTGAELDPLKVCGRGGVRWRLGCDFGYDLHLLWLDLLWKNYEKAGDFELTLLLQAPILEI
jgi:hypothetical protein